ncbi:MAG: hypothetical protein VX544_04475 [Pseudomonadota bacterium]|nr:hypothetical protein [Pseudomonadota bacterium]
MKDISKYIYDIEHLDYANRQPSHATFFENKQHISNIVWDIYGHNACEFYKTNNNHSVNSEINKNGYVTGKLSDKDTKLLQEIFKSCEKTKFDPFDFNSDYVYEPRKNHHEDMVRIYDYYEPSKFLFENLPTLFDPLSGIIEKENGFYFKVASLRIFSLKPNKKTQGFHTDAQPFAIKKFFFYPYGANKEIGSTHIINKSSHEEIFNLPAGSWMMFENNVVEHQAYSNLNVKKNMPVIEIDIMADFKTDTTLNYNGVNSWYPWFPLFENKNNFLTNELNYDDVYTRNLQRILGMSTFIKSENYKFPCDLKDIEGLDNIFDEKNEEEPEESKNNNLDEDMKNLFVNYGVINTAIKLLITLPIIFFKKILKKRSKIE